MLKTIQDLKNRSAICELNELIPYAATIGLQSYMEGKAHEADIVTVLKRKDSNIGNYLIGAVHGGVVAALLEHAAIMHVLYHVETINMPRIINLSVDYLRPCRDKDTFAKGLLIKQGKKIVNVRVEAWQDDTLRPVAAAHAHFQL